MDTLQVGECSGFLNPCDNNLSLFSITFEQYNFNSCMNFNTPYYLKMFKAVLQSVKVIIKDHNGLDHQNPSNILTFKS